MPAARPAKHTLGHRGRAGDPLYRARRTLQTGADLLTDTQRARLDTVFAADEHVQVEATWGIYQRMVAAYREPNKTTGKQRMRAVIESVASGVPDALVEIRTLGRTLKRPRRRRARLLRPARDLERADRGHQRPTRTPPRLRPRLPQPHPLHRPISTRGRRIQTPTTPSTAMSRDFFPAYRRGAEALSPREPVVRQTAEARS